MSLMPEFGSWVMFTAPIINISLCEHSSPRPLMLELPNYTHTLRVAPRGCPINFTVQTRTHEGPGRMKDFVTFPGENAYCLVGMFFSLVKTFIEGTLHGVVIYKNKLYIERLCP